MKSDRDQAANGRQELRGRLRSSLAPWPHRLLRFELVLTSRPAAAILRPRTILRMGPVRPVRTDGHYPGKPGRGAAKGNVAELFTQIFAGNRILMGIAGTLLTDQATGVGCLPVLFTTEVSERMLEAMLGFAAGVMLAATAFSLIVPAIELGGIWSAVLGILIGGAFLAVLDKALPHLQRIGGPEGPSSSLHRAWLLIIAITLHHFPEGLAVGVGFGADRLGHAVALMTAIALQNVPEGLSVALPLARERWSRGKAVAYAAMSGLAEPIAGLLGVVAVTSMRPLLP